MIEYSLDYIRNPIWVSANLDSCGATRLERIALELLEPARYLVKKLSASPVRDWTTRETGKNDCLRRAELYLIFESSSLDDQHFSKLRLDEKIYRFASLLFATLAAALMTPLGLLFHQLALVTSEEVRKKYEEIESWKNYPGLLLAKAGRFDELRDLIKETPPEECSVFAKATPGGNSVLNTLLLGPIRSLQVEKERQNTLELLINHCEKENFHEYFSSPVLLKRLIQTKSSTILLKWVAKYEGRLETFFGQTIESHTLLDLAAAEHYNRENASVIPLLLIEKCPADNLLLLLGPKTDLLAWHSPILEALLKKCPESKLDDCMKYIKSRGGNFIAEVISSKKYDVFQVLFEKYPRERIRTLFQPAAGGETLWDLVVKTSDLSPASNSLAASILTMCPSDGLSLLISPTSTPSKWQRHFQTYFNQKIESVLSEDNGIEMVRTLLTQVHSDGNTVLHRANQRPFFGEFAKVVNIKISEVYNRDGLSPADLDSYALSLEWLKKPKFSSLNVNDVSREMYRQRASTLKNEVLFLWDSLVFGTGDKHSLPLTLLMINGAARSGADIRGKLDRMLDKIVTKEAWLGTPRSNDAAGLHLFYSEMLLNFEAVIAFLKKVRDPLQTAGYLIDIAKVEFEERCAAAYQEEIEQKALLCAPDETQSSVEQLFERAASKALRALNDKVLRTEVRGSVDVHYSRRLSYASGLVRVPDPLAFNGRDFQVQLLQCRGDVLRGFNLSDFIQDVSRNIESEMAIDLTKALVPRVEGYSLWERWNHTVGEVLFSAESPPKTTEQLYRQAILEAKERESSLKTTVLKKLAPLVNRSSSSSLFSSSKREKSLFRAVQELKSTDLPDVRDSKDLIATIISEETKRLQEISSCPELDLSQFFTRDDLNQEEVRERTIEFLKSKNKYSPLSRLKIQNQLSQMATRIERAQKFLVSITSYFSDDQPLSSLIKIQKNYQRGLKEIIETLTSDEKNNDLDLSFDQNTFTFPSEAFENSYKNWKTQDDLLYKGRMVLKLLATMKILNKS